MIAFLYLFPACVDLLVGSFFFVGTVRLAESGADPVAVGGVLTVWGVSYMTASLFSGRLATRRTYIHMIVASSACMGLCALAFIAMPSLKALYFIIAFFGVAVAFFFPPYMVFMKDYSAGRSMGLVESTAIYTFAWSLGLGAGPFIAGFLWNLVGWRWVFVLDVLLAIFAGAGTFLLARRGHHMHQPPAAEGGEAGKPDMAWVARFAIGVLLLALSAVRGLFPSTAALRSIPKFDQGIVLALICAGQATMALVVGRKAAWMYKALPIGLLGAVGTAAFVLFGLAERPLAYMAAAYMAGLCAGLGFVYFAFHALVHPSKAGRNIGINEAVVGFTGIVGPLAGGGIASMWGHSASYLSFAALYCLAAVAQTAVHAAYGRDRRDKA